MFFNKKEEVNDIETKIISNIKALTVDLINSNHKGNLDFSLNFANALYVLYSKHIKIDISDPMWLNRDRVIFSTNNGYNLLLSIIYMMGSDIKLDKDNTVFEIPGVDFVTEEFANGIGVGVGSAIGEAYLNNLFKNNSSSLFDYYTYVICSDLDMMKGGSFEALSLASSLKLNKLILLYDSNSNVLPGNENFLIDKLKYFESLNLNTIVVDKDNLGEIDSAIAKAKSSDKPSIIVLKNSENKYEKNYIDSNYNLTLEEISNIKKDLDVRDIPFSASSEAQEALMEMVNSRMKDILESYNELVSKLDAKGIEIYEKIKNNDYTLKNNINYELEDGELLEDSLFKILNSLVIENELFVGGTSNYSDRLTEFKEFNANNHGGNNINYDLRNNISSIQNGLSLVGIRNFSITNLFLADRLIPSIKLAAKMKLPNIYILFEDNNTSLNNEIIGLRSIPGLDVFRPNDVNELLGVFNIISSKNANTSCIIIGRGIANVKENSKIHAVKDGAYIFKYEDKNISGILLSTGIDLDITLEIEEKLKENGYDIRVVSMPCMELYNETKDTYREEVLPMGTKVIVIENSPSYSWYKYVYNDKYLITSDKVKWFTKEEEKTEFIETMVEKIENLLG